MAGQHDPIGIQAQSFGLDREGANGPAALVDDPVERSGGSQGVVDGCVVPASGDAGGSREERFDA